MLYTLFHRIAYHYRLLQSVICPHCGTSQHQYRRQIETGSQVHHEHVSAQRIHQLCEEFYGEHEYSCNRFKLLWTPRKYQHPDSTIRQVGCPITTTTTPINIHLTPQNNTRRLRRQQENTTRNMIS